MNWYAYCLNNPVRYVDPTGHEEGDYNSIGDYPDGYEANDSKCVENEDSTGSEYDSSYEDTYIGGAIIRTEEVKEKGFLHCIFGGYYTVTNLTNLETGKTVSIGPNGLSGQINALKGFLGEHKGAIVDIFSILDALPLGPVGMTLDVVAFALTTAVLARDYSQGKISFNQFSGGMAMNGVNLGIGIVGNYAVGLGTLGKMSFTFMELSIFTVGKEMSGSSIADYL